MTGRPTWPRAAVVAALGAVAAVIAGLLLDVDTDPTDARLAVHRVGQGI